MINIKATLNGEDYTEVSIPKEEYTYEYLKTTLKSKLTISTDEEIEIFDSKNTEIKNFFDTRQITFPMSSDSISFQVALLNNLFNSPDALEKEDSLVIEEKKGMENVMNDGVSKNKYSCSAKKCRKTFMEPAKLFNHIKIHFKNKPYKCTFEGCGKSFLCKGQRRNHMNTHNDSKRFECDFPGCGKGYSKNSRLIVHKRSHTGEKPFV
jgi:uncharacterized Zn-finger protein